MTSLSNSAKGHSTVEAEGDRAIWSRAMGRRSIWSRAMWRRSTAKGQRSGHRCGEIGPSGQGRWGGDQQRRGSDRAIAVVRQQRWGGDPGLRAALEAARLVKGGGSGPIGG
ncbi:hypothetical protein CASFOL_033316 [Castilleja foliolosa]|uniref:Uncharacterized protein n=1 Tax=Castilleja foliolosa TaxID=1961234 RepID=A0ABD3BYW8_9LAMI